MPQWRRRVTRKLNMYVTLQVIIKVYDDKFAKWLIVYTNVGETTKTFNEA